VAGVLEHGAQSAAAHEGDHRLLAQLGNRDGAAAAEGIAVADRVDERLGRDHARSDPRRNRLSADADDRYVDVAVGDRLKERLVLSLDERNLHRGMGAMEVAEHLGEAMVDWPCDADLQSSVQHAPQGGDRVAALVGRGESRTRVRQERLAGDGKPDRALMTMKKRFLELGLEPPDLRAHGRLGHRNAGSGARELPLLRNRHEVRELPQVHNEVF